MLAIKSVLNDRDGVGTVVFDEVDTGISGKTSRKVGIRLCQMGRAVQVICITHAAQIASLADVHYLISKSDVNCVTETKVCVLDRDGRIQELSRILGGIDVTEAQKRAAIDMLEEKKEYN
jgi:DNA repair protein RecN (Recombination protein N)